MTVPGQPRHAAPAPRSRILGAALAVVVAVMVGAVGYLLGSRDEQPTAVAPAPVKATTQPAAPLRDGQLVVAGDGRAYFYRGYHQPATFGTAHPLVSDTRGGPVRIAPGLKVSAP